VAKIELEFTGQDSDLQAALQEQRDLLVAIRDASKEASSAIQQDAAKNVASAEKFNTAITSAAAATVALGKTDTGKVAGELDKATASAEDFEQAATSGADAMDGAFTELIRDAKAAAKEQGILVKGLDEQKQAVFRLLVNVGALTKEEAKAGQEALELIDAFEQAGKASKEPAKGAITLREQIRAAKIELDALIESSDGKLTPQLIAAAQKAGQLDDRMKDLNDTVRAFNPDERFGPAIGILNNIASGGQAAAAAIGLLGDESEDVGRALLKIQQVTAFVSGLQGLTRGLVDNFRNLRTQVVAFSAAQRASTAATAADAAAKGIQATATGAATTATFSLSGAIKGLTAALAANPFTAIAVALLALGAALVSVLGDARDFKAEVDDLISSLDELAATNAARVDLKTRLEVARAELDFIRSNGDERAKQAKEEKIFLAERQRLIIAQLDAEQNTLAAIRQLRNLEGETSDEAIEARQTLLKAAQQYQREYVKINGDIQVSDAEARNTALQNQKDLIADREAYAKKRRQIEEQLANDLLNIQKDLDKRVKAAELAEADPRKRLDIEREAAFEEIRILEQNLKRKIALIEIERRIGVEAFSALSEAQKQARADALIDDGQIALSLQQVQQLQVLETATWNKFYEGLTELDRKNIETRLELEKDGNERALKELDIELTKRGEALRAAGATEEQILEFKRTQRANLRRELALKDIELEEQLATAQLEAMQNQGQREVDFETDKQIKLLNIQIEFAQKRLVQQEQDNTKQGQVLVAQTKATIANLQNEVKKLEAGRPQLDLFELLGLNYSDAQKQQIVQGLQEIANLASVITDAAQQEVEANISATDQIIADRERRADELNTQLDREIDLARLGYANNVDLIRRQLQEQQRAAAEDKQRRRDLLAERRRLAKQQLAIDAITQGSSLVTAAAQTLAASSSGGIPGIIAAVAAIAGMIAFFVGIQQRARAITAQSAGELGEGGIIKGPRHSQGGVPIPGTNMVAEGGEMVTNRKSTKKHFAALQAINSDNFDSPAFNKWLSGQLLDTGVKLDEGLIEQIVQDKHEYSSEVYVNNTTDNKRLEKKVEVLTAEVSGLRSDLSLKEDRYTEKGKTVIVKGNKTTKKRG